jgi:hypothetical protein
MGSFSYFVFRLFYIIHSLSQEQHTEKPQLYCFFRLFASFFCLPLPQPAPPDTWRLDLEAFSPTCPPILEIRITMRRGGGGGGELESPI